MFQLQIQYILPLSPTILQKQCHCRSWSNLQGTSLAEQVASSSTHVFDNWSTTIIIMQCQGDDKQRSDSIISTILFPQHLINGINQCCHFLLVVHKAWPFLLWVDQLAIHLHLKPPRGWRCAFTSNLKITWEFILKLCLESGELGPVPSSTAVGDMNFDSHIASRSSPSLREVVVDRKSVV